MKPNNVTGMSGAGRNDRNASSLSAQLTEASGSLESNTPMQDLGTQYVEPSRQKRRTMNRLVSLSILGVGILAAILMALHEAQVNKKQLALDANQSDSSSLIKPQAIPLNDLGLQALSPLSQTNALTVNGDVDVAGSVLLSPTTPPPSGAVAGQLYFDAQKNQIGYYNGSSYVYLQGGSAGATNLTTVKNVTNLTKVTNVTDDITNQYITTGITAINGTAGSLAMFDGVGGLTESLVAQSGNNLNTGTGVENVTIGSTNGVSTTVVQGGTGNVAVNTGAVVGNSGSISIQTGDSSTTAAGNVSIDTGGSIITGTQIADKTFEDGVDNMGDATFGDNTTLTQSSAEAHGGTHSLAVAVGSNFFPNWSIGDGVTNPPLIIPVSAGHTYAFSAWIRAGTNSDLITASVMWSTDGYGGGGEISQQDFGSVTDVSTGWKQVAGVLTAPAGAQDVGFIFSSFDATSVGELHYFDDITVTDLSSSSSMAALNLGATNAQIITIGNSGMLAPTTIYGGGVNVNGGTGFVNISGANLTETAGGADYSTTSGALDITAATSSTWKIGGSNGTGGNLNIAAGDAGGNNNGGDLILSGGAGAGTGTGGSVIVQPQTDSTTAFQVRNSGGSNDLLNVDTSGSVVSIATGGASTANIGSIAGSLNFGYTSVGNRQDVGYQNLIAGEQFTASTTGTLTSMSAYIGNNVDASPNNEYQLAIYTDNGSNAPDQYITSTTVGTITANSWNTLPLSVNVTAGTKYWLVFWTNTAIATDNGLVYNNVPGSSLYYAYTNGVTFGSGADNGMPATFPTPSSDKNGSDFYSLYASYSSGIGTALNVDATGAIHANGSAVFQEATNSTTAFEIQSSDGNPVFTADTANAIITVANLVATGDLTLEGHFITSGSTPTYTAGAAACTSPTINISGNDTSGTISVQAGSSCTSGDILTVNFVTRFGASPHVVITPGGSNAAGLNAYVDDALVTQNGFEIGTSATPATGTTYLWNYFVTQ